MLGFVNNWFAPKSNPIGVDFGSDCLRLAQVRQTETECRLIAAACADVPTHARHDPAARLNFFVEAMGDLLSQGGFHGRQAVLSLPASQMFIQHLKLPRMDDAALKKALPWEARGKLPIDPTHALLRHMVAGDIYSDQDPKQEIILMAASREMVNHYLSTAARAKLDVVGMNVEPKALIDCFSWVYRRKTDLDCVNLFVDIGATATRAVIAQGSQILFARAINVGGDQFNKAVASAMGMGIQDARVLRVKLANQTIDAPAAASAPTETLPMDRREPLVPQASAPGQTAEVAPSADQADESDDNNSFALLGAGLGAASQRAPARPIVAQAEQPVVKATSAMTPEQQVHNACQEPLARLCEELDLCRRYYESTFPSKPVSRIVFVGGEAQQRALCTQVARTLSLAAQVGDPMARMSRTSDVGIECGIDRRVPQPAWAVAIGLSLGPAHSGNGNESTVIHEAETASRKR